MWETHNGQTHTGSSRCECRQRRARTTDGTVHRRDGANTRKRYRDVSRAGQDRLVPLRRRDVYRRVLPARSRHADTARRLRPHCVVRELRLTVVIGANGAGKTTWTRKHREMLSKPFYNADSIEERDRFLAATRLESAGMWAATGPPLPTVQARHENRARCVARRSSHRRALCAGYRDQTGRPLRCRRGRALSREVGVRANAKHYRGK